MQLGVIVVAIAIAVGYGAVFSFVYPLVQVDASLVALSYVDAPVWQGFL
jgi:hypothetical protein